MRRRRSSLLVALSVLALSAGCAWWFSHAYFHQLVTASAGLGR
jgi:hypothetical protein